MTMDFNLTEEQRQLREGAQRFLREQYTFQQRRKLAAGTGFAHEHWAQFAELGWLALGLPESAGGLGLSRVETALLAEELGRALVLEPFVPAVVLCTRLIERSELATREALLGNVASGELILALAHAEPQERYAVHAAQTLAESTADGGWRLSGLKTLVVGAPFAHSLIVSATLEGEPALFLVPADSRGLTLRPYALIDGSRAADVQFDAVEVPADKLLARGATATDLLAEGFDRANLAFCGQMLGCTEAVMEITSEYIKTRKQFGQAIGKFQALQHRMAEMFVEAQEARSALYRGLAAIDDADARFRQQAIAGTCVAVGSAARFVCEQGIQLHGGIGLTDEYEVGHYYKHVLVAGKLLGDADWHLDRYVALGRLAA